MFHEIRRLMKKIMFNDRYGLTEAVLSGRKTQTRRIICCPKNFKGEWVAGFNVHVRQSDGAILEYPKMYDADETEFENGYIRPKYQIGEVVAVAQSYKDIACGALFDDLKEAYRTEPTKLAGWTNKMFVRADLMPHNIRITNVRIERLQDISSKGCIKESVEKAFIGFFVRGLRCRDCSKESYTETENGSFKLFPAPREAYAALIDRIYGKGTWERNPFVFVYDFELVR